MHPYISPLGYLHYATWYKWNLYGLPVSSGYIVCNWLSKSNDAINHGNLFGLPNNDMFIITQIDP